MNYVLQIRHVSNTALENSDQRTLVHCDDDCFRASCTLKFPVNFLLQKKRNITPCFNDQLNWLTPSSSSPVCRLRRPKRRRRLRFQSFSQKQVATRQSEAASIWFFCHIKSFLRQEVYMYGKQEVCEQKERGYDGGGIK